MLKFLYFKRYSDDQKIYQTSKCQSQTNQLFYKIYARKKFRVCGKVVYVIFEIFKSINTHKMVYYIGAGQVFTDPSALPIVHHSHA